MFWTLATVLSLGAIAFVAVPLWLRSRSSDFGDELLRREANIALFQERSDELEKDLAEGIIDQGQHQALLVELQSSLLADVGNTEQQTVEEPAQSKATKKAKEKSKKEIQPAASESGSSKLNWAVPLLLALLVPLISAVLYQQWGYLDDVRLMDEYQRTVDNQGDPQEAQALIVALGEAVREDESQPWAWYFLAENLANLSLFTEAEIAYQRAADLLPESPEKALVLGRIALSKYILAEFQFTPEILAVVNEARAINPSEISILQLLAADAEQREDWSAAIEYWRLLIQTNPNSQQAQVYREQITEANRLLAGDSVGPSISVTVSLREGLPINGDERVFIAARNAEREGMPPLAAVDLNVSDLPATFVLDDSRAVGPFNLSSAESVYIAALLSRNNSATAQSGDYRVVSDSFAVSPELTEIQLVIGDQIP